MSKVVGVIVSKVEVAVFCCIFSVLCFACWVCLGCALFVEGNFYLGDGSRFSHDMLAIIVCVCHVGVW